MDESVQILPTVNDEDDDQCSICLEPFTNKALAKDCQHNFCYQCIYSWVQQRPVCPLCIKPIKSIMSNLNDIHYLNTDHNDDQDMSSSSDSIIQFDPFDEDEFDDASIIEDNSIDDDYEYYDYIYENDYDDDFDRTFLKIKMTPLKQQIIKMLIEKQLNMVTYVNRDGRQKHFGPYEKEKKGHYLLNKSFQAQRNQQQWVHTCLSNNYK